MDIFGRTGITPGEWMRGAHWRVRDASPRTTEIGGLRITQGKSGFVFVTGDAALDAKLRALPDKLQKKLVRKALRKGAKRVADKCKQIVRAEAYETGAYEKSIGVRAMKRSRVRLGVTIHVDRDKFFERYKANYGKEPHPAKGETEPFYVPAAIEFGTPTRQAVRPQRRALYENEQQILQDFRQDLIELTREA